MKGKQRIAAEKRFALLHDPYRPPRVKIGQKFFCQVRGTVTVAAWSDGPIPWPRARQKGKRPFILCGDLVRAVRSESREAICHWWGVSQTVVSLWRAALGVKQFNAGTTALYTRWRPVKLPSGAPGQRVVAFSPRKLKAQRRKARLYLRQVAEGCGWTNNNTYQQMEAGRRRRATLPTLRRIAKALGCRVGDLLA